MTGAAGEIITNQYQSVLIALLDQVSSFFCLFCFFCCLACAQLNHSATSSLST